jgi:predicted nucleic acid-binding protein
MPARQTAQNLWTMTEDAWSKELVPIPNLLKKEESWNVNPVSIKGCVYDPHDEKDAAFIDMVGDDHIWTLIEGDEDDTMYIISGKHHVNRHAYFVTCLSLEEYLGKGSEDDTIEIKIDW